MTSPDTLAAILLWLAALLVIARVGGWLAELARQPAVLGELLAGIAAGALFTVDERAESALSVLAELGVIVLLFEVGLESSLQQLKSVGLRAFVVAIIGVAVPVGLGFFATRAIDPDFSALSALFIGATLAATSVGITARVLRDLGKADSLAARIVLGAAVVDDVLGLLLLSFLVAGARGTRVSAATAVQPVVFLAFCVLALPPLLRRIPRPPGPVPGLALCLLLGFGAHWVGLAPIVGAFAAGLAISSARQAGSAVADAPGEPWDETSHDPIPLRVAVRGIAAALVPLFFVEMGRTVDLRAAVSGSAPVLLAALIAVAVVGKILSGIAAPRDTRLAVGIGMIPRGEVGLIFAGLGRTLGLVDEAVTSTLVLVVLASTLVAPPLLRWRLSR